MDIKFACIFVVMLRNCGEATGGAEGYGYLTKEPTPWDGFRMWWRWLNPENPDMVFVMFGYNDKRIGLPVVLNPCKK